MPPEEAVVVCPSMELLPNIPPLCDSVGLEPNKVPPEELAAEPNRPVDEDGVPLPKRPVGADDEVAEPKRPVEAGFGGAVEVVVEARELVFNAAPKRLDPAAFVPLPIRDDVAAAVVAEPKRLEEVELGSDAVLTVAVKELELVAKLNRPVDTGAPPPNTEDGAEELVTELNKPVEVGFG